jgi:hypothetical protein
MQDKLERQMIQLAQARVNDAVKLAYLDQEDRDMIDKMDLTALTEFKRAGNGAVEVKFADRMKTIERLLDLYREDPAQQLLRSLAGEDEV